MKIASLLTVLAGALLALVIFAGCATTSAKSGPQNTDAADTDIFSAGTVPCACGGE